MNRVAHNLPISDLQIINAETVQNRVHAQLRELMMVGKFQPGQALKIIELAEGFGTSAQPVRESIRQLITERALEALPNRSARVPILPRARIDDLRRIRLAIEGLAAEMATECASAADIKALNALMKSGNEADEIGDTERSVYLNAQFHFTLYKAAGSTTLMPFIESLWLQIGPAMRQSAGIFDRRDGRGAEMHARMIEGLVRRDKTAVVEALQGDINRSFDLLLSHMSNNHKSA